jgi:Flp pilus assembly pilin Flp
MLEAFRRLRDDRSGVTAIEYAVLVSLIAVTIVIAVDNVGTNLAQAFASVDSALPGNSSGGAGTTSSGGGGGTPSGGGQHHGDHDDGH